MTSYENVRTPSGLALRARDDLVAAGREEAELVWQSNLGQEFEKDPRLSKLQASTWRLLGNGHPTFDLFVYLPRLIALYAECMAAHSGESGALFFEKEFLFPLLHTLHFRALWIIGVEDERQMERLFGSTPELTCRVHLLQPSWVDLAVGQWREPVPGRTQETVV